MPLTHAFDEITIRIGEVELEGVDHSAPGRIRFLQLSAYLLNDLVALHLASEPAECRCSTNLSAGQAIEANSAD